MANIIQNVRLAQEFIYFRCTAKSAVGYGIHSPFVYDFARKVVRSSKSIELIREVEWFRNWQENTPIELAPSNFGAGSKNQKKPEKLSKIIQNSSVSKKTGAFLYRLAKWANAINILEIGTSVGISTMYLASSNPNANVVTLEGDLRRTKVAQNSFDLFDLPNIKIIEGDFELGLSEALQSLPSVDLVFFDGNHKAEPTLRYFKQCSENVHENTVFVFDDIRWSKEMFNAWTVIANHQNVSLSIDLFSMGVIFFRKGIKKQHMKINF